MSSSTQRRRSGQNGKKSSGRTSQRPARNGTAPTALEAMNDEQILIRFMPHLKDNHAVATRIHEEFCNDQRAFIAAARKFLMESKTPVSPPRPIGPKSPFAPPGIPSFNMAPLAQSLAITGEAIPSGPNLWNAPTNSIWGASGSPPPSASPIQTLFSGNPPHNSNGKKASPELPKATPAKKREAPAPKRLWTHFVEQPGRITVNNVSGQDVNRVIPLSPRSELSAHWSLPMEYLKRHRQSEDLAGLTVGLFRRGCVENGTQASIISKVVVSDRFDVWKDGGLVRGRVPFYAPRTPGFVIFRLYWEDDPLHTLAMGPSLLVRVLESDLEGSVKFILSNFRGKKTNPTSLSSLHSLAIVFGTVQLNRPNDAAARAVWGCISEARKVLEACAAEYHKMNGKMQEMEVLIEEMRAQQDELEEVDEEQENLLREKTRIWNSGKASSERKWRDSQQAYASILKAILFNPSMTRFMMKRDLLSKLRMEYELWCPLSEEFASPDHQLWLEHKAVADPLSTRIRMQESTLGFEPQTVPLQNVLYPNGNMNPTAVAIFNKLSASMGMYYQKLYANEDAVVRQRQFIQQRTQECVDGVFPTGTRVVIFGSSANGFGSPKSDVDMCLQLPHNAGKEDAEETMTKLATALEEAGMKEVDTSRLGARIPIIMFHFPIKTKDDEEEFIECDLSMHNTLAVLNTSLLRAYAEISPVTRVLASVIKRWAKARDINNPARHTLSSYGYIIMLLHYLTYHKRNGNGLMIPVHKESDIPILPNLQWMDPMWPNFPNGTPYKELESLPNQARDHPLEESKTVNGYFYQAATPNDKAKLQSLFPGQDLSLAILLASFFRYYAYEFDYKRHVVSMHSTARRGKVEREVKAEVDGWRNYSAALTIEDPFETFYDVAHVLRGGYYHRIRREFALAYSKIVDAINSGQEDMDLMEAICEPVEQQQS